MKKALIGLAAAVLAIPLFIPIGIGVVLANVQSSMINEGCSNVAGDDPAEPSTKPEGGVLSSTMQDCSTTDEDGGEWSGDVDPSGPIGKPIKPMSVTSGYGARSRPCSRCSKYHRGTDMSCRASQRVLAIGDGTVSKKYRRGARGNVLEVTMRVNGQTVIYRVQHLASYKASVGQKVKKGQQLAVCGNTGVGTGRHLHVEILIRGRTVNPMTWFKQQWK